MNEGLSPAPGHAWFEIVTRDTSEAFALVFTRDAALQASVLNEPLAGGGAVRAFFQRTVGMTAAMAALACANAVACAAPGYWVLMGARVLLAIAAGLYVPSANALASALLEPERRGTALSIVSGGTSVAIALGVPLDDAPGGGADRD